MGSHKTSTKLLAVASLHVLASACKRSVFQSRAKGVVATRFVPQGSAY
jgi:hypothetical protein